MSDVLKKIKEHNINIYFIRQVIKSYKIPILLKIILLCITDEF